MSEQALWVRMQCDGARVLVVGGGSVAARKVEKFLAAGARVEVMAPVLGEALSRRREVITWHERVFTDEAIEGFDFVIAATSDSGINARIARVCTAHHVPVNVADTSAPSSFHLPATRRAGPIEWAVFLGGASPALTVQLMGRLEELFAREEPWWQQAATMLGRHREGWMRAHRDVRDRSARWRALTQDVVTSLREGDAPEKVESRFPNEEELG